MRPIRCKRCRQADQDWFEITSAHVDSFGQTWVNIMCQVKTCQHVWTRKAEGCEHLRGYDKARKAKRIEHGAWWKK